MPMSHHPSWQFEINSLKLIVSIFYPLFLYGLLDNFMTWIIKRSLTKLEKIYLQGKPAGQRRADEAASAQYLRRFWQGYFITKLFFFWILRQLVSNSSGLLGTVWRSVLYGKYTLWI